MPTEDITLIEAIRKTRKLNKKFLSMDKDGYLYAFKSVPIACVVTWQRTVKEDTETWLGVLSTPVGTPWNRTIINVNDILIK